MSSVNDQYVDSLKIIEIEKSKRAQLKTRLFALLLPAALFVAAMVSSIFLSIAIDFAALAYRDFHR